jgi:N6-adenosine-specific RNA methylase IME4
MVLVGILMRSSGVDMSDKASSWAPVPPQRYRTIVVDPPWELKAGPGFATNGPTRDLVYPTMTVEQIKSLSIREMSDNLDGDAHLYLWTVNAWLRDAYDVARGWGFHPTQVIVWTKSTIGTGLGGSWPSNVEFVLFCRRPKMTSRPDVLGLTSKLADAARQAGLSRGDVDRHMGTSDMAGWWLSKIETRCACPTDEQWLKLKRFLRPSNDLDEMVARINAAKGTAERQKLARASSSWFTWPRGKHSAKPEAFLDIVEQVSPGPYAELFARRARFGWDYPIGDQALGGVAA